MTRTADSGGGRWLLRLLDRLVGVEPERIEREKIEPEPIERAPRIESRPLEIAPEPPPPPPPPAPPPPAPLIEMKLPERTVPVDPVVLKDRPRGLDLEGDGAFSLFSKRISEKSDEDENARLLAAVPWSKPPAVGADDIEALLEKLPVQSEITRLLAAVESRKTPRLAVRTLEEMKALIPPSFVAAMLEIASLTRHLNPVELYTADDLAKVKDRFLEAFADGRHENPKFTYDTALARLRKTLEQNESSLEGIEARLHAIRREVLAEKVPHDDELSRIARRLLLRKIGDDLATIELAHGLEKQDDALVKSAFARKYGHGVDDALLEAARLVYGYLIEHEAHSRSAKSKGIGQGELPEPLARWLTNEDMFASEMKEAIEWMLDRYYAYYEAKTKQPFPESAKFKVEVSDKYSAIDVRDKSSQGPTIGLPPKMRSYKKSLELLRHEIDQHVRQSLNGQLMFAFGGGALKIDEEVWYEGLAKHAEIEFMRKMFGDDSEPSLPYYTFALKMAEEGKSFVEVFETIRAMRRSAGATSRVASENAWNAAYRTFRGHTDTSNREAFGMPKDQAYLRGWMLQKQLATAGLGHLNEAAIADLDGLQLLARFDLKPDDLIFPDLDLTARWFEDVLRPKAQEALEKKKKHKYKDFDIFDD
jgi:hypothetical protein